VKAGIPPRRGVALERAGAGVGVPHPAERHGPCPWPATPSRPPRRDTHARAGRRGRADVGVDPGSGSRPGGLGDRSAGALDVGGVVAVVSERVLGGALKVSPELWLGWEADGTQALSGGRGGAEQSGGVVEVFLRGRDGGEDVQAFRNVQGEPFGLKARERVLGVALGVAGVPPAEFSLLDLNAGLPIS
jgi:hypothetical protein